MKGFSIALVFGRYGGFYVKFQSHVLRVCLGWVALTIYPRTDIEAYIELLAKKAGRISE